MPLKCCALMGSIEYEFCSNINTLVLITRYQFSQNYHGGILGVLSCYFLISLLLTFGVHHQDLVVRENVAVSQCVRADVLF